MPDLSRARRRRAVAMLRDALTVCPTLDDDTQLVYVVGVLVADAAGEFSERDLACALADPSVRQATAWIMQKAVA